MRGHDKVGELVLAHQTILVSVEFCEECFLLSLGELVTTMQGLSHLVEEERGFILLEEMILVGIHLHPQGVELGRVHVHNESAEVPEQHGEGYLMGGLVLRDLLLSRQGVSSQ